MTALVEANIFPVVKLFKYKVRNSVKINKNIYNFVKSIPMYSKYHHFYFVDREQAGYDHR